MKLSEMKNSPDVGLPQTTHPICVSGKLVKELHDSDEILFDLQSQIEAAEQRQQVDRPEGSRGGRKLGQKGNLAELKKQATAQAEISDGIRERMQETTVELLVVAKQEGEWRQFRDTHPPRDEDTDAAGYARDRKWAGGFCNIDDVIASAGDWVEKYGDEDPAKGSWEFIAANAAPGDLTKFASVIVGLHEQGVDLGKSRRTWLDGRNAAGS